MTSQTLREARKYGETLEKLIHKEERPDFHLSARVGWMNDPNGFSYYDGKYHMFYQYHPYESKWGPMHWGHAVSDDLLHWEYLPAALAPDESYDRDGCFSGSALELPDGRQLLMYTSVIREHVENDEYVDVQTQSIAVGDGMDYVKYGKNPVLDERDLPEGGSRLDFRDPKIWRKADGSYCCVVGNRPADGSGQILLFVSRDGFDWHFKKVLVANNNRFGKMWECPDFFELDGKWLLLTSPQDMFPEGYEYHNGNGTLCLIELILRPGDKKEIYHKCAVRFAQNEQFYTSLSFRPRESILKIDRKFSGSRRAIIHQRRCKVNYTNNELKLRIILDRFSAEVFVNDGEHVLTATMYTDQAADGISFFADGSVCMDVVKYNLI